jgi:UDP-glucose 4-epimerase
MKKIILITGWTGYIGSHWVVAFEQAWYKTVIVDNLSNSSLKSLDWIENILGYKPDFFEVDLRNKDLLEDVFKKYNFDWVFHFAWLKAVWESCNKPLEYFDNNIVWSLKLFELMEKYSVKNIIFSSSATVYDSWNFLSWLWVDETWITWNTTNPYWTTKYLLEQILLDLSKFSWFKVMNLRYFNPIWAHESWYLWEDPFGIPNNLLPFIMKVANSELRQLQVFWNDYDTVDGTGVRDYIDVVDLIDGHLKAYEKLSVIPLSQPFPPREKGVVQFNVYNLWVGKWVSVLEMIREAEKIVWKKIEYKIVDRRSGDVAEVFCNPGKALQELWWKSETNLEDSLRNSWRFYNKK